MTSKVTVPFYLPNSNTEEIQLLSIFASTRYDHFYFSHYVVLPNYDFNLSFPNN